MSTKTEFVSFVDEYVNFLLSSLPGKPKVVSNGKEITCRCMYCSDSENKDHGHFYISIPQTPDEPSKYFCQKCGERGFVTHNKLLEWNLWNQNVAMDLINHNKNIKYIKKNGTTSYRIININNPDNPNSQIKVDYINNRLGTNYTIKDMDDLKICLNLKELLSTNHITSTTRSQDVLDQLDINFLGFISVDNVFLNMRRLCDKGLLIKNIDKRYINYNIFNVFDTSNRFYTIPVEINPMNIPVKIHIAEGPFDILSIYENVRHREPGVYTAIGGGNYIGLVLFMLNTIQIPCCEIHIYPDNDNVGRDSKMNFIYKILKELNIPLYIHRNVYPNEKDFGVRPDHIIEQVKDMQRLI